MIKGTPEKEWIELDVLVENLGRVNYGFKLNGPTQVKGIRGESCKTSIFIKAIGNMHWHCQQINSKIDYTAGKNPAQPSFYQAEFTLTDLADTFIDCRSYGKGVVIVNGINLGRYWQRGPIHSLYCPKEFLKKGTNEIVILKRKG